MDAGTGGLVSCGCGGRHPVAVEEVIVIGWMYAGDSELAEKTGGRAFCREEVVFVGGGHFLRTQMDSRESSSQHDSAEAAA